MITVTLIGGGELVAKWGRIPASARDALRAEVQKAALALTAHVKQDKLTDQVLRVRTGRLRRSITQRVEVEGSRVMGYVGTNVEYAAAHEYGIRGSIGVREHLRRSKQGKQFSVRAHLRNVNIPERSFLRSALADMKEQIVNGMVTAIQDAVK